MSTRNGFISATIEPFEAKFNGVEIVGPNKKFTRIIHLLHSNRGERDKRNEEKNPQIAVKATLNVFIF